jgi:outer membrane lipoprotein-sorting protein
MNKLFWLISAALAFLIIIGCIQTVAHDSGAVQNASASILPGEDAAKKLLHEMPAHEIAAEFVRHNANLSGYSATVHTVGESGYEDEEFLFFAQRPDRFRAEYIRSEIHGNGTIVVANGTFVWQYHPDTRKARPALIEDPSNTFFALRDYPAIAARILEKFPAIMNGTEDQSGSNAVIIEAAIDNNPTQYYPAVFSRIRVWIDEESLVMTRMEIIGAYKETVLTVELRNTSLNPPLSESLFDFEPPAGTEISPSLSRLVAPLNMTSAYQAKVRFGPDFVMPSELPPGYKFRYCLHYRDRDGRDSFVYSNGTDELVFTEVLQKNNASLELSSSQYMAILIGNRTGIYWPETEKNHLRWNDGNGTYQLSGTITKEGFVRVAQSLTAPALLNFAPDEIKNPDIIAEIALKDPSARRMADAGGEILGVGMSVRRSTSTIQGGVFPALYIRYNGLVAYFMVDPDTQKPVGRTIQVPNNAMVRHVGDQTVVEYNGEILFTFDPMEGTL